MPPLPTIADVFRVTLDWAAGGGATAHNVMHFSAPSKTAQDVFDTLDANVTASMWDSVYTSASVTGVDVLPLDGSSSTSHFAVTPAAKWTGNGGGDYSSRAPAAIIKLATGLRGPSNRGRVFLPFTSEQDTSGGLLSDSLVTAITGGWVAFANAMEVDGVALGVASYVGAGVWHQAINIVCHKSLGTLGRRQRVLLP